METRMLPDSHSTPTSLTLTGAPPGVAEGEGRVDWRSAAVDERAAGLQRTCLTQAGRRCLALLASR
jgi:hypothetical protein